MLDWFPGRKKENITGQQETLSAYIDEELSVRRQAELERELARDPALRAELGELRQTVQMVHSLPTLAVPRSFALAPAIYGRVRPRRLHLYPVMRAATVLATLLFVFLFASDLFSIGAMAPAQERAVGVEVTRVVAKELAVTELVEMEQVVELAEEESVARVAPKSVEEEEVAEHFLEAPAEDAAEMIVEGDGQVAAEAEPEAAPAAETAPAPGTAQDALSPSPLAAPPGAGTSAGGISPTVTVPALLSTEAAAAPVLEESIEEPVEEPVVQPVVPAEPTEEPQESEWAQDEAENLDWQLVARLGAGVLAVGLLAVTLLARRFGW